MKGGEGRDSRVKAESGTVFELSIASLAYEGWGVGRRSDGVVVFVPFAAPGDRVLARAVSDRGRYVRAELLQVLAASPQRVSPPCPHFGTCGGCQWQHVAYGAQLEAKRRIVTDALARIGGVRVEVSSVVPSPRAYRYRNRARFHLSASGEVGFYRRASREIVVIASCPLLDERLDAAIAGLRGERGPAEVELRVGDGGAVERAEGLPFGQVNAEVNGLLQEALQARVAASFGAGEPLAILDLYCGDGNLSLPLAAAARRIAGYDASAAAVASAAARARSLGASAEYRRAAITSRLLSSLGRGRYDLLLLDPPRRGLGRLAAPAAALGARLVALVSCAPPTLARDLRAFLDRGYSIELVQPFDMFPQTYHVETLVTLRLAGDRRLHGPRQARTPGRGQP